MANNTFSRLKLYGWRQFQSIDIELHHRLTIITGANGAGKSTILSFFTRHFGYNRNYLGTYNRKGGLASYTFGIFDTLMRGLGLKENPNQGQLIGEITYSSGHVSNLRLPRHAQLSYQIQIEPQLQTDGLHIDSHRPPNIYRHVGQFPASPPEIEGIGNGLNSEYMNYYVSGSVNQGSLHHIKEALISMSIFGHGNRTMEPIPELINLFDEFEEKLRLLLPKSLGFQKLLIRSPEVLLSTKSGDFLIDAASGGIIKMIEIAWQIYFYSRNKKEFVVTFDEPENHLHPSMQKTFLPNIMSAFPNAQLIVVTHSPFIISAMKDSYVYVIRYADTLVKSTEDDDESIQGLMGAKVSAERLDTINKAGTASEILRDVLGISTTIPDWAEDRVSEIANSYRGKAVTDSLLQEIFSQLQKEGLASSYPSIVSELTRLK